MQMRRGQINPLKAIAAGIASILLVGALWVVPALADGPEGVPGFGQGYGYLPGWGYGDQNHEHSGPPGLDDQEDSKPGRGSGDENHEHSGPPGLAGESGGAN